MATMIPPTGLKPALAPTQSHGPAPPPARCIAFLLFLVVAGVIALVVVKVINPNKKKVTDAVVAITPNVTIPFDTSAIDGVLDKVTGAVQGAVTGRRLFMEMMLGLALGDEGGGAAGTQHPWEALPMQ